MNVIKGTGGGGSFLKVCLSLQCSLNTASDVIATKRQEPVVGVG